MTFPTLLTNNRLYTVRMTIIGLKARCHNCQRRGHLARECEACGRCGNAEHATADHPPDVPFSTFADRVRGRRRRAPPAHAPGEMDVTMSSEAGNQETAPRQSRVTVNALIQERLAARVNKCHESSAPVQRSFTDAEGFEVPKDQRDKAKRRRGRVGRTPNSTSENGRHMPDIEERDEEVSDSETSEVRSKLPRTDRAHSHTESPQLLASRRRQSLLSVRLQRGNLPVKVEGWGGWGGWGGGGGEGLISSQPHFSL